MHSPYPCEPDHEASPTAHLLDEIALFGYRPFSDEADPRPLPEDRLALLQRLAAVRGRLSLCA
ncbi:MAG: hypothetical protein QUV11_14180, partial [Blastomonas sp.]|nr:hypothetical protein [Blastomonas sp.]